MNTRIAPAATAGTVNGKNTRQKIIRCDAPREAAAWRSRSSIRIIDAYSGRTKKGSRTLTVPIVTPSSL